jgi:hypothetical protein
MAKPTKKQIHAVVRECFNQMQHPEHLSTSDVMEALESKYPTQNSADYFDCRSIANLELSVLKAKQQRGQA